MYIRCGKFQYCNYYSLNFCASSLTFRTMLLYFHFSSNFFFFGSFQNLLEDELYYTKQISVDIFRKLFILNTSWDYDAASSLWCSGLYKIIYQNRYWALQGNHNRLECTYTSGRFKPPSEPPSTFPLSSLACWNAFPIIDFGSIDRKK